jgi:serine/threonine-protein kinase TTK/MPS1
MGTDLKIYAVKRVYLEKADQATIDSYTNEIGILQRLTQHKTIIRLIDAELNLAGGTIYLVEEFGEIDLAHLLRQQADHFNENHRRVWWQQMLEAVHTIHEERIIHGDLKPANFVLVQGMLKLIDFGIAKTIKGDTTNIVQENTVRARRRDYVSR